MNWTHCTHLLLLAASALLSACGGGDVHEEADVGQKQALAKPGGASSSTSWQPAKGLTPVSGNYVYLESGQLTGTDPMGLDRRYLYTHSNALFKPLGVVNGSLLLAVQGTEQWNGRLAVASDRTGRVLAGSKTNLSLAGLLWEGEGRSCSTTSGWVVVDSASYSATGTLAGLVLRFEQRCNSSVGVLRGKLRWTAADVTPPLAPVDASLAAGFMFDAPQAGSTAAASSLGLQTISTETLTNDLKPSFVANYSTAADASLSLTSSVVAHTFSGQAYDRAAVEFQLHSAPNAAGDRVVWTGSMRAPVGMKQLQAGLYSAVGAYSSLVASSSPYFNPAAAGMNLRWVLQDASGAIIKSRQCRNTSLLLVVDRAVYDAAGLLELSLRFQQDCEPPIDDSTLFGQLIWRRPV